MSERITDTQVHEARTTVEFCNALRDSRPFQTIVLPFMEGKQRHHLAHGTDVNLPADKRAEHHHALALANEFLDLLEKRTEEARAVIEQYREENPSTFV